MPDIRRTRISSGVRSLLAILIAAAILLVINLLSARLYAHWSWVEAGPRHLSNRTIEAIGSLRGQIDLYALFERSHPFRYAANTLIHEFEEASTTIPGLSISAHTIDPNQDLPEAAALLRKYPMGVNSILIVWNGQFRVLDEFELNAQTDPDTGADADAQKPSAPIFRGEQACTLGLLRLARPADIPVYFLTGHGEFDPSSAHPVSGASILARNLASNGFAIHSLLLSESQSIPQDCAVLVIAGPRTLFSQREIERISAFLSDGGRMFLLVDEPYANGLSPLLAAWDIQIEPPYASLTRGTGVAIRKTSTTHFGNHPVTVPLTNTRCVFAAPCAVGPLQPGSPGERGDKPAVSGLIFIDPPGAAAYPIAAASELGAGNRMENPANPRLIVCGDSDFISNAVLSSGMEGNLLFFLSSMQWLAGFQRPLPQTDADFTALPGFVSDEEWKTFASVICLVVPLCVLGFGLLFWIPLCRRLS